jgi:hypothetical protein
MNCPYCNSEVPSGREICPNNDCYKPLKPIPVPPNGKIRFGNYDWYALDKRDGRTLILTEKVIERRQYYGQPFEITWETRDMRKYLNNEFYDSFSENDRARIIEIVNENHDDPWYGASGGNPTADRVFLLSIDEVIKYFGDSGQIKNRPRVYENCDWCKDEFLQWTDDQYLLNRRAVDDSGMVVHWRLRSPGANGRLIAFVMGNCADPFERGAVNISGGCGDLSSDGRFLFDTIDILTVMDTNTHYSNINGIRPALWPRSE